MKFPNRPFVHLVIIVLLGLAAYSNAFNVPFVFDDFPNIVDNPLIRDISNIPLFFVGTEGWVQGAFASRPLLQATLALNYYFGGLDTWGYHVVNLGLHLINGLLVYFLIVLTGRAKGYPEKDTGLVAVFSALLFVVHPVQTDAVTYIVSRSMLLSTTFYLMGLILFLKAATSDRGRGFYIGGLFLVSLLGMASRENFVTFPAMLLLYDLFFISGFRLREVFLLRYKIYLPVILSLIYVLYLVFSNTYDRGADFPKTGIPPLQYVMTQFNVHWTYLRLMVLPISQNVEYDYPTAQTLFEFPTILSFLGYMGLGALSIVFARKRPVVSFGVLWFLITLAPISFLVALLDLRLGDVIFEHRLYLPSVGAIVALVTAVLMAFRMLGGKRVQAIAASVAVVVVLIFSYATYARNSVWTSQLSLWEDVVGKSPNHSKVQGNLGLSYYDLELYDKAIEHLRISIELNPSDARAYNNIGLAYVAKGLIDKGIRNYRIALAMKPDYAAAYNNLGSAYYYGGQMFKAAKQYKIAISLQGGYAEPHYNLGRVYFEQGRGEEARKEFVLALKINPRHPHARQFLGYIRMVDRSRE